MVKVTQVVNRKNECLKNLNGRSSHNAEQLQHFSQDFGEV